MQQMENKRIYHFFSRDVTFETAAYFIYLFFGSAIQRIQN